MTVSRYAAEMEIPTPKSQAPSKFQLQIPKIAKREITFFED